MSRPNLLYRVSNVFFWFRHVGWMYLTYLILLFAAIFGLSPLTVANHTTKMIATLFGVVVFSLRQTIFGFVSRHRKAQKNTHLSRLLDIISQIIIVSAIYSMSLCLLFLPWYCIVLIFVHQILSFIFEYLDAKEMSIPTWFVRVRNLIFIFLIGTIIFQLAQTLGWL